jgi:hypothetical protein
MQICTRVIEYADLLLDVRMPIKTQPPVTHSLPQFLLHILSLAPTFRDEIYSIQSTHTHTHTHTRLPRLCWHRPFPPACSKTKKIIISRLHITDNPYEKVRGERRDQGGLRLAGTGRGLEGERPGTRFRPSYTRDLEDILKKSALRRFSILTLLSHYSYREYFERNF